MLTQAKTAELLHISHIGDLLATAPHHMLIPKNNTIMMTRQYGIDDCE